MNKEIVALVLSYEEINKCLEEAVNNLTWNQKEQIIAILLESNSNSFVSQYHAIKKPTIWNFIYSTLPPILLNLIIKKGFMISFPETYDYYQLLYKKHQNVYDSQLKTLLKKTLKELYLLNKIPFSIIVILEETRKAEN